MNKAAIVLLVTAALLGACSQSGKEAATHEGHGGQTTKPAADSKVKAEFKLSADKPQAKQNTDVSIRITDDNGKPIDNFDINHEKKMHLIVVSRDLSYFNHIHPEYKGKGQFDIATQFPAGGDYKLFADFVPTGQGAMTKSAWTTVQGDAPQATAISPDAKLTKVTDGKEVTLAFDHLMAGMELNMTFTIKDAATNKPVTDLQPYLGAVGHVVILSADAEQYLHVHPMDEKATGPEAKFMTTFPKSGVYKLWGQFQHNGNVFTVPFTVQVP